MKYSLSVLSLALCVSAAAVQAQTSRTELQPENTAMVQKTAVAANAAKYGVYQLQPELVAVPQALADRNAQVQDIGNMALVSRSPGVDVDQIIEFRRNAVVQNRITGELGVVTGNISLLSKADTDMQQVLQQYGLSVVRSAGSTGIYIVQPTADVDLLNLVAQLNASGLVKTARLDILEKKFSNQ